VLAVCPGSFDPITNGHFDVIARAAAIFDEVVVAVGQNAAKNYLFEAEARLALVRESLAPLTNVTAEFFDGLVVDFVTARGGGVLVKGVRFASDFEFELQMANMNKLMAGVETLILPAAAQWSTLSSTLIRDIANHGGDVSAFVPEPVARRIRQRSLGKEPSHG
jgi:pantetheine-phosphate adenylyltransferase